MKAVKLNIDQAIDHITDATKLIRNLIEDFSNELYLKEKTDYSNKQTLYLKERINILNSEFEIFTKKLNDFNQKKE